jgi:glutaconate CoA-transferase subunit A
MPFEYFSDEFHIKEWLTAEKDPAEFKKFIEKNIFSCRNFNEYLEKNGGLEKCQMLRRKEFMLDE